MRRRGSCTTTTTTPLLHHRDRPRPRRHQRQQGGEHGCHGGYCKIGIWISPAARQRRSQDAHGSGIGARLSSYLSIWTARITQITDEIGNQFYAGNQETTGPTGSGAVYSRPAHGTWADAAELPHSSVHELAGKSYTVGSRAVQERISFVQKGLVADMLADGASVRFTAAQVNDSEGSGWKTGNLRSIKLIGIVGPAGARRIINRPGADLSR